jgi:hypothetical protein
MGSWPEGVPFPPKPQKPEGITDEEWEYYQNSDYRHIPPGLRTKVHEAMGWKVKDVQDAEEIAERVGELVANLDREAPAVITRLRAALRLLENEHITPQGRRILEKILDEEEKR